MAALLEEHGDRVAAVIVEPLVQGAAGMRVHPEGYLRAVRELCDRHGVFLICDEVATGFGRTGRMFACEHEGVAPDLLCLAKGVTGGYLPLAATLTTERIYEGFLGRFEEFKTFFHGHTFTGNPLACAAALASLDVFEREQVIRRLQAKIEVLGTWLARWVEPLETVAEVRRRGFMTGIQLTDFPLEARVGHQVTLAARRRGRDHPPPRRRRRAHAAALHHRGRPAPRSSRSPPKRSPRRRKPGLSARPASHPPGGRQRRPPKPRKGARAQHRPRDGGAGQRPRGDARGDRRRPPLLARDRLVPGALGADVDEAGRAGRPASRLPPPPSSPPPCPNPKPPRTRTRETGMTARSPIRNGLA